MERRTNRNILITGACGTVGEILVETLLNDSNWSFDRLIGVDNRESELVKAQRIYEYDSRVSFHFADIRDSAKMSSLCEGMDVVIHAAALKHVSIGQQAPEEIVKTNLIGLQCVLDACIQAKVRKFVFTSSDKAVNPTSAMGTSKLMGEYLVAAAAERAQRFGGTYVSLRFGNILLSSGSVLELFASQISKGVSLTLTDPNMTRFVISRNESAYFILGVAELAINGSVFIRDMPSLSVGLLAQALIEYCSKHQIVMYKSPQLIGARPGEKLYEELYNDTEKSNLYKFSKTSNISFIIPSKYITEGKTFANKAVIRAAPNQRSDVSLMKKAEIIDLLESVNFKSYLESLRQ